jgi:O-antigen/teichoic acid export membrane protein/GT2 family glycosyltransferase
MSLTNKIIRNTYYYAFSQIAAMVIPFILTPFIISKIGEVQFGIYAIVLGLTMSFGLFDLSLSSSFIKFISEYYNKKDTEKLNSTINTGLLFYFVFSAVICAAGYLFSGNILSILNIPPEFLSTGKNSLYLALLIFFVSGVFTIFSSALISIQKMYITSIITTVIAAVNFILVIILLNLGYGLEGILASQLFTSLLSSVVTLFYAMKNIPEMKLGINYFRKNSLREMGKFGVQMQVSKLAGFFSDKYDEFLLAAFSVLNNVTYFNIANRVIKFGRLFPFQIVVQIAPVAAELSAKNDSRKLKELFGEATKYLTLITIPIFFYAAVFADHIILFWMGVDYSVTVHIIRILAAAQIANMVFSAPGNSITPNIGIPKFQMKEGLLHLALNLILSFLLIKYYGIIGAAYGNSISTIISSLYIYYVSCKYFGESKFSFILDAEIKPVIAGIISSVFAFALVFITEPYINAGNNRIRGMIFTAISLLSFSADYIFLVLKLKYLRKRDKSLIAGMIIKIIPVEKITGYKPYKEDAYAGELVSFCVVTHNRPQMLKKCIESLLSSTSSVNREILIWDNNSTEETTSFLKKTEAENNFIRVNYNKYNIGNNAKGKCIELAKGDFIIGIDDDVIEFPENWAQDFISAYKKIPLAGYLATDVIQNEHTDGAKQNPESYEAEKYKDVNLLVGPTGGWCFVVSREVYNTIGRFYQNPKRIFYFEDADYGIRALGKGFRVGIVGGLKVFHATGEYYNREFPRIYVSKMTESRKDFPLHYKIYRKAALALNLKNILRKLLKYSEN